MRNHVYRNNVPELARLAAPDHEADDFICFFGHKRSALARSQVILKLEPRIRDVVAKRSVVDLIEPLEVGWSVLANLHRCVLGV
jgi:hypothetical protein